MKKELKLQIIEHLEKLGNGEIKPRPASLGVCSEIQEKFNVKLIEIVPFTEYPNFSGDNLYPIPHYRLDPETAYTDIENMWDKRTKYGRERMNFCLWSAQYIRLTL